MKQGRVTDSTAAEGIDETGLPAQAYVPTQEGQHAPIPSATQGYSTGPGTAAAAPVAPVVPGQMGAGTGASVPGQGNKTVFDAGAQ